MSEILPDIEEMQGLGPYGSYSMDVINHLYPDAAATPISGFPNLLGAIHTGVKVGTLVPIDSSMMAVPIRETIPEFMRSDLMIEREIWLDVVSNVVGVAASIDEVEELHSKDVALAQGSEYRPSLIRHNHDSTADAAKYVAEAADPRMAAVGSIGLAGRYGLNVLDRGIQNEGLNRTVMVVTRGRNGYVPDLDHIADQEYQHGSMLIKTRDSTKANALARALAEIGDRDINMDDIVRLREPRKEQMQFFIRFAGVGYNIADLLRSERAKEVMDMQVIGVYDRPVLLNSDTIASA